MRTTTLLYNYQLFHLYIKILKKHLLIRFKGDWFASLICFTNLSLLYGQRHRPFFSEPISFQTHLRTEI